MLTQITITDIAPDGRGIGILKGKPIYIPYTIPGETLMAHVHENRGVGATLLDPSADRIEPRCPHFGIGKCGGCQWQHMTVEAQIALKTDLVAMAFEQVGIPNPPLQFTRPSPQDWHYNHTAVFIPVDEGLGFAGEDGESVIAIDECLIISPTILQVVNELNLGIDTLTALTVQVNEHGAAMLTLQTRDDEPPELEITLPLSLNFLLSHHEPLNLIGHTHLVQRIHDRHFRMTAGVESRPNLAQVEQLVALVLGYLDLQPTSRVLDLYGGVGIFSAFVAPHVQHVTYVDSYPPAATDAEVNLADFDNIDIVEGRVEHVLEALEEAFDIVIIDPPQRGMNHQAILNLGPIKAATLVYVGQNPTTLARDAKVLIDDLGYRLIEVQPLDFAPHTAAVECVALFQKKKRK